MPTAGISIVEASRGIPYTKDPIAVPSVFRLSSLSSRWEEGGHPGFCRFPGSDSAEAQRLSGESRSPSAGQSLTGSAVGI